MSSSVNRPRRIAERDKILLWGRAAARCSHPDCKIRLDHPGSTSDSDITTGFAAHIVGHSDRGPRADKLIDDDLRGGYENLILLCGTHHALVDKQSRTFTVELLRTWKAEHESWVKHSTEPMEPAEHLTWAVVFHEDSPAIDATLTDRALPAGSTAGSRTHVRLPSGEFDWHDAADKQRQIIDELMESLRPQDRRLAVFSLAPIPLAVHLGSVISDRCRLALFQYDRDEMSWQWKPDQEKPPGLDTVEWRRNKDSDNGDVVIRVSLSAEIHVQSTVDLVSDPLVDVRIGVERPTVTWLQAAEQLREIGAVFRGVLERVRAEVADRCERIHLFYAGPISGAIEIGRQHKAHIDGPMVTYQYNATQTPCYLRALVHNGV